MGFLQGNAQSTLTGTNLPAHTHPSYKRDAAANDEHGNSHGIPPPSLHYILFRY